MATHTVVVASVWKFYDANSLMQSFQQKASGFVVRCSYEAPKNHFILVCKPTEESEVSRLFLESLRDYVSRELKKRSTQDYDPFDLPFIEKVAELRPFSQQNYFEIAEREVQEEEKRKSERQGDLLIEHESAQRVWQPLPADRSAKMSLFSAEMLTKLCISTRCRMEWRPDGLYIWADTESDAEHALERIKSLETTNVGFWRSSDSSDIYFASRLAGHKFKFSFATSAIDESLFKHRDDFATGYLELHAVVWDTRSLQWLSVVRQGAPIHYPDNMKSHWLVPILFEYGDDSLRPADWAVASNILHRPMAGRLSPAQAKRVSHWAQQVDVASGLEDGPTMSVGNCILDTSCEIIHGRTGGMKPVTETLPIHAQWHTVKPYQHPLDKPIRDRGCSLWDSLETENVLDTEGSRRAPALLKAPKQALTAERDMAKKVYTLLFENIAKFLSSLDISSLSPSGFEVEIGQIFTKRSAIPRRFQGTQARTFESFSPHEWGSVYYSSIEHDRTIFSPKISGAWQDIEFIINDLADHDQRYLFERLPQKDFSTYVLTFASEKSGNQAVLKMSSDERRPRIFSSREVAGSVNLHFPKQVWDARFAVFKDVDVDRELERDMRPICDSLWIHGDGLRPDLERLYAKRYARHVVLKSAELRREIIHAVRGPSKDISLHLSRVEVLKCANLEASFCAFSKSEEAPAQDHGLWEARLVSGQIDKFLTQGSNYEIRDVSCWKQQAPLHDALVALTQCVIDTVNGIDDVGCSSRRKVALNGTGVTGSGIGHASAIGRNP